MRALVLGLFVLASCCPEPDGPPVQHARARRAPQSTEPCGLVVAKGTPAQLTIAPGASEGVTIDPPQSCPGEGWNGGWYIRLHGHGRRHFDWKRRPGEDPCDRPDADAAACPTVSIHSFSASAYQAIIKRVGASNVDGLGLGICASASAPLSQWNISSRVHDWAHVDEALRAIDEELRRWDLGDDYGLSVSGISCATLLDEAR